ncbi:exonuclease domain-containing protein [Woeseia oceani]|nr:exonuclease domain-containing protein [Woeseia oceani]
MSGPEISGLPIDMDFISIDVETANPNMASICQIGVVRYSDGVLREEWESFVDPNDYFDGMNIAIHGITEEEVAGAPAFKELYPELTRWLGDSVVICHTHFDRLAIVRACDQHFIAHPSCQWLDSSRVARRAWSKFAWKGYGLANLCNELGYTFSHHNALEDAKAAAQVFLAACQETGLDVAGWIERVEKPVELGGTGSGADIRRDGNPDGTFFGDVIAFTGALAFPRKEAADLAASVGFRVSSSVTKKVTTLVVGVASPRFLVHSRR